MPSITDLPPELLHHIVNFLFDENIWQRGYLKLPYSASSLYRQTDDATLRKQTIRNLRLTSRAWCAAASHCLLPILRIELNEKSLARAEAISNNRNISSGIMGVDLGVGYCSSRLSNDLEAYTAVKLNRFDTVPYCCPSCPASLDEFFSYFPQSMLLPPLDEKLHPNSDDNKVDDDDDDDDCCSYDGEPEDVQQAYDRWESIKQVWDCNPKVARKQCANITFAQEILQKGFARFKARGEEQHDLVSTGRFATSIARILGKLPSLQSICMRDKDESRRSLDINKTIGTMLDDNEILEILAEPLSWAFYVRRRDGNSTHYRYHPQNTVASLLWDIPVALHRAGISVGSFYVSCFPSADGLRLGSAENGFLRGKDAEFRGFMSSLKSFYFGYYDYDDLEACIGPDLTDDEKNEVSDFLGACISSRDLRIMNLQLLNLESAGNGAFSCFPIGRVFDQLTTEQLERVHLEHVGFSESEFGAMLARLNSSTKSVWLENFELNCEDDFDVKEAIYEAVGGKDHCDVHVPGCGLQ